ncbi:chlorhexidine efflux transporter [Roseobacter sinensis]|uniref:chlorhexidine efflux transporter n=1 Tax=Roseobacter sinensis TaxID=2931391 RepID=UPI00384E07CF
MTPSRLSEARTLPPLRSVRERVIQTVAFEAGGLLIAVPLYGLVFERSSFDSFILVAAVSTVLLLWLPIHNTAFDLCELRLTGRAASDRPHRLRFAHAICAELTSTLVTWPVIVFVGGHGVWVALAIDVGLSTFYVLYGYLFHLVFDRLRPVPVRADDVCRS